MVFYIFLFLCFSLLNIWRSYCLNGILPLMSRLPEQRKAFWKYWYQNRKKLIQRFTKMLVDQILAWSQRKIEIPRNSGICICLLCGIPLKVTSALSFLRLIRGQKYYPQHYSMTPLRYFGNYRILFKVDSNWWLRYNHWTHFQTSKSHKKWHQLFTSLYQISWCANEPIPDRYCTPCRDAANSTEAIFQSALSH